MRTKESIEEEEEKMRTKEEGEMDEGGKAGDGFG